MHGTMSLKFSVWYFLMLNTKENYRNSVFCCSLLNTRTPFMLLGLVFCTRADPSDCAVKGMSLRSLDCLNCGFLSLRDHGCLSVVNAECSKVEGSASG